MNKLSGWDDTIVALATPPGIGALGIIRLSGHQAISIANRLFPAKNLLIQPSHTLHVGLLEENGFKLDEAVVSLYRAPKSYTGEDVVEFSCHGSPYIHEQIIHACLRTGARLAKPGEFTQRAFLNGKMDLTQAEAVADLIASNTGASHKTALSNIRGGFSAVLADLREQLIRFSALIELELDFSQEDVEFADRSQLNSIVTDAEARVRELLQSFKLGNVIKNGVQVAIVGRPNSGKSTLLNTLLNENRAIVSDIAGTTRDTIEEVLNIDGILFRLIDTAGIREHTSGIIENMGIEKSLEKIRQSDIVVYLFDVNEETKDELQAAAWKLRDEGKSFLLVGNKIDSRGWEGTESVQPIPGTVLISAKEKRNIDLLQKHLVDLVLQGKAQTEGTVVTNARHYKALQEVNQSLLDIQVALDTGIPADLIALDIRRCLHFLGEITGEITNEDQLDYIFSKFCIGK